MPKEFDLNEFADRVERVCDFFLSRTYHDGSADLKVLEDLKSEAADIQTGALTLKDSKIIFYGLNDYMHGV